MVGEPLSFVVVVPIRGGMDERICCVRWVRQGASAPVLSVLEVQGGVLRVFCEEAAGGTLLQR